jgi:hypothetical protein
MRVTARTKICLLVLFAGIVLSSEASANMKVRPDHDWTVSWGREGVGLRGYDRKSPSTVVCYGFGSFGVPLPIYSVASIIALLAVCASAMCLYAFRRRNNAA